MTKKTDEIILVDHDNEFVFSKKMDLYYIEWEDAIAQTGWLSEEEAEKWFNEQTMVVKQIGWIVMEEENYIGVVSRMAVWDKNEVEYGQLQKIPKTWIRRKIKLTKYIK